jgi:hypothetical protein
VRCDAVPATLQRYFQQILPLAKCDAGDGRVVGQLLVDLMSSNPKDLARAIREFADRTAMLRDCGFAHIGGMLARLLSADVQGRPDDDTTGIAAAPVMTAAVGPNRSALTEKQAIAIGCAIASSVHRSPGSGMLLSGRLGSGGYNSRRPNQAHAFAEALNKVVQSHGALRAMKSDYAWFVPMLKVVMAHKAAEPRGSVVMNRLRSMRSSIAPVAPIGVASDADTADEESGFRSVVRLGAPHRPVSLCAHWLVMPCGHNGLPLCIAGQRRRLATTGACGCPCGRGRRFDSRCRARSSCRGARLGFA